MSDESIDAFFELIKQGMMEREQADDKPYDASEYKHQEGGGLQKMIESSETVIIPQGVFNMLMTINNLQIPEDEDESNEEPAKSPSEFYDIDLFNLIEDNEIPKDKE